MILTYSDTVTNNLSLVTVTITVTVTVTVTITITVTIIQMTDTIKRRSPSYVRTWPHGSQTVAASAAFASLEMDQLVPVLWLELQAVLRQPEMQEDGEKRAGAGASKKQRV